MQATGHQFATFVGVELVDYVRKTFGLARRRENTYLMGFSMGGFDALHTALQFPEVFGKTAALSSALIVHEVAGMKAEGGTDGKGGNAIANYAYYRECFGEPSKLLENNREFHGFLDSLGVKHVYIESKGIHDMIFWQEYATKFIPQMMGE